MADAERILDEVEGRVRAAAAAASGEVCTAITREMTRAAVEALDEFGLFVKTEHGVTCDDRMGRLDVAGFSILNAKLLVAIEFDIVFKLRSLRKLEDAAKAGAAAFWIRWGVDIDPWERACVGAGVRYVAMPVAYLTLAEHRLRIGNAAEEELDGAPDDAECQTPMHVVRAEVQPTPQRLPRPSLKRATDATRGATHG
ncbi:MAG: hypothetical protein WCC48_00580 [Anaeromyxobacteraceae bacterium]